MRTGRQLVVILRNGYNVDDVCKQAPVVRGVAPTLDDLDATENFIGSKGWHFVGRIFGGIETFALHFGCPRCRIGRYLSTRTT
jgi:hypothetical protein